MFIRQIVVKICVFLSTLFSELEGNFFEGRSLPKYICRVMIKKLRFRMLSHPKIQCFFTGPPFLLKIKIFIL